MKQDPFSVTRRASTPEELAEMFMNPNTPKTEAEHWAVREIERQRAENEQLRDQIYESIPKWQANEMQREINRLRDAMQFYADPNRYKSTSVHMCGHSTGQSVMIDGGRKAREALKASQGS